MLIRGQKFDIASIHKKETESLANYYASDNPFLSEGIEYYAIVFKEFLYNHADPQFFLMNLDKQNNILKKEMDKFQKAMQFSFNKGHKTGFLILLKNTKDNQVYDADYFSNPNSLSNFLYSIDKSFGDTVISKNLNRDANTSLINFTLQNFVEGRKEVEKLSRIFFKKGIAVAFEQIRDNIMQTDYQITGYSRMLSVPYNQDFIVTPAFKGTFCFETPNFEEWDIFWDATYDISYSNTLVAKVLVHSLTMAQIKKYSQINASAYKMLQSVLRINNYREEDLIFVVEINFALINPADTSRLLRKAEYQALRVAIANIISRKLQKYHVDEQHILLVHS